MSSRPSPPPPRAAPTPATASTPLMFGAVQPATGVRVVPFGPGGVGKTTMAAMAPGPVGFFDLDESLGALHPQLAEAGLLDGLRVVQGITTWAGLRAALQAPGWNGVRTIVIDSATKAEELAVTWMLENIPHESGSRVNRIEGYGYGKGYSHLYETFLALLGDLDQHVRAGRNVVLVCHDCTATVPNPAGEDWIRYEPRLSSPASGKASIRLRVREWADHVLYLGYDIDVSKDGKGRGSGTRTAWPNEMPHCMAKSRTLANPIPIPRYSRALWEALFPKG